LTCLPTNEQYIGKTTESLHRRWRRHIANKSKSCRYLCEAIDKYGENNFKKEILIECEYKSLDNNERKFIKKYNTLYPKGFNLQTGGSENFKQNEDTIIKMRNSQKGKIIKEQTKKIMSISRQLSSHSKESKNKMKLNHKNKKPVSEILLNSLEKLELKELPKYIQYHKSSDKIEVNVPLQKRKSYANKTISLEDRIKLAIEYRNTICKVSNINNLSKFKILSEEDKNNLNKTLHELGIKNLPMHIYFNIINNSETITVRIPNKKEKTFSKKNMSLNEKIKLAIEYKKSQS
jgi:group I intron endonuclease